MKDSSASNKQAIIVTILGIGLIVLITKFQKEKENLVHQNYEMTIGYPVNYSTVGQFENCYIDYEYKVLNKKYSNSVGAPDMCNNCDYDIKPCADKRYWVAYQKDDPSNSLINLYLEIQNVTSPKPPATLDNFR